MKVFIPLTFAILLVASMGAPLATADPVDVQSWEDGPCPTLDPLHDGIHCVVPSICTTSFCVKGFDVCVWYNSTWSCPR